MDTNQITTLVLGIVTAAICITFIVLTFYYLNQKKPLQHAKKKGKKAKKNNNPSLHKIKHFFQKFKKGKQSNSNAFEQLVMANPFNWSLHTAL